jgi:hypothetical protein
VQLGIARRVATAVIGPVCVVVPRLLAISRPFLSPAGLYAAAVVRLVFGTALILAAPTPPRAMR